jgi:hypothetical protein
MLLDVATWKLPLVKELAVTDWRPAILLRVFSLEDSRLLPIFVPSDDTGNL